MAVLTRHARLLYLLALFQLVGGPLVLGGLMLVARLMTDREMTLSQGISHTLDRLGRCDAGEPAFALADDGDAAAPVKQQTPQPKKVKDTKDKLWAVNDLPRFAWARPVPISIPETAWHDPVPRRLANAPPLPPPRWS